MLKSSAIFLTHYMEIGQPLVEVTDGHLFRFFYRNVKAVSQGKQIHP